MLNYAFPSKILVATNNQGKLKEIRELLSGAKIQAVSPLELNAFKNFVEPEETGKTFAANSFIKAQFYAKKSGLTSLADDSGLCIEALDGIPGIHSARFALDEKGEKNFPKTFEKIFELLKARNLDVTKDVVKAHFICNLTIYYPQNNAFFSFEGRVDGKLCEPRGSKGFGYDPIFIKDGMHLSFCEIDPELKDQISHRGEAFKKFLAYLKSLKS